MGSIPLGGFTPGVVRYHIIGLLIRHWLTRMSLTNIGHFVHERPGRVVATAAHWVVSSNRPTSIPTASAAASGITSD